MENSSLNVGAEKSGSDEARWALNPWTLRFWDEQAEREYFHFQLQSSLKTTRSSIFFGTLLYLLFGILDYVLASNPEELQKIWLIRYGLGAPFFFACWAFTWSRQFEKLQQFSMTTFYCAATYGLIAMVAIADTPIRDNYFAGLLMVMTFCSLMFGLYLSRVIFCCISTLILYHVVVLWVNPVPFETLINNFFFLCLGCGLAIYTAYVHEAFKRKEYRAALKMQKQYDNTRALFFEAESASKSKTQFMATISHELRTPLNAINGFADIIRQEMFGDVGNKKYAEYANDIFISGSHLLGIINDILDYTKTETGQIQYQPEPAQLSKILDTSMKLVAHRAHEKGILLAVEPFADCILHVDARLIQQALINLITNSIKYGKKIGAEVTVSITTVNEGYLSIVVQDNGIGIKQEDIAKALEPFVQLGDSMEHARDGLGLGLPLVKRIMEMHAGSIQIESIVGEGTQIYLNIPISTVVSADGASQSGETLHEQEMHPTR